MVFTTEFDLGSGEDEYILPNEISRLSKLDAEISSAFRDVDGSKAKALKRVMREILPLRFTINIGEGHDGDAGHT